MGVKGEETPTTLSQESREMDSSVERCEEDRANSSTVPHTSETLLSLQSLCPTLHPLGLPQLSKGLDANVLMVCRKYKLLIPISIMLCSVLHIRKLVLPFQWKRTGASDSPLSGAAIKALGGPITPVLFSSTETS